MKSPFEVSVEMMALISHVSQFFPVVAAVVAVLLVILHNLRYIYS